METLLVVLVIGCALALAVHVGRGVWYRPAQWSVTSKHLTPWLASPTALT